MSRPARSWNPRAALPALTAFAAGALLCACKREPPPGAETAAPPGSSAGARQQVGSPTLPSELIPKPSASGAAPLGSGAAGLAGTPGEPVPWAGPYLVVTDTSAGVYGDTSFSKKQKIGYLRSGGKVPVSTETVTKEDCPRGWYRLRDGGFVCGNVGTTNLGSPEARFAIRTPDASGVLPYTYARNAKNGTPLYKSVPTIEQMREYEPYLVKKTAPEETTGAAGVPAAPFPPAGAAGVKTAAAKPEDAPAGAALVKTVPPRPEDAPPPFSKEAMLAHRSPSAEASPPPGAGGAPPAAAAMAPPAALPDGGADDRPWWQREDADKRLHEVKLDELSADADDVLAKRMVKGFYVAVDREFNWNGRPWYKTTKGLVAPADRFWITKASEFHGVELDGAALALPMGFTFGWQKSRPKYTLDPAGKLVPAGALEYHAAVALTGKDTTLAGKKYVETRDGFWVQEAHLRVTRPGPPPVELGPNERWVDVNLTTQTIVVFEGTRAVYASLISSGKESKIEDKDHRTPTGEWRIREKHVTTTMDGDGSAAGDLPYSIEDVPYVMYFHRAFALHGAFWHSSYGTQMSHGCVNLSPLDAKWVFAFTEPHLPEGWHGVWATPSHPGSRVVVHE